MRVMGETSRVAVGSGLPVEPPATGAVRCFALLDLGMSARAAPVELLVGEAVWAPNEVNRRET